MAAGTIAGRRGRAAWALAAGTLALMSASRVGGVNPSPNETGISLPETITLTAIVRDFRAVDQPGGHMDFQRWSGDVRIGLVSPELDTDGKPTLQSRTGFGIAAEFRNAQGQPINPALFNPALGDTPGQLQAMSEPRVESAETFAQWYRDVPGVNVTINVPLTLRREPGSNIYVFDSASAQPYAALGGFFPINDQGYGNYASTNRNFHFTTEIVTTFSFRRGQGQTLRFSGDDDVWVFIDNTLVIDLGGTHPPRTQVIDLDRLAHLQDGRVYSLRIFHAERRTMGSNFRIETTLQLRAVAPPASADLFD